MDKNKKGTMTYTFLIVALVLAATVYFVPLDISSDENFNKLFKDIIIRLIVFATLCFVVVAFDLKSLLHFKRPTKTALPVLFAAVFVALVNFPLHALIVGSAKIDDGVMCVTLAAECVAVAAMEELFFRGILFEAVADKLKGKKNAVFFQVIITAAAFSLFHLLNLLSGAGVGATALQVLYTFLLGCLFATLKQATDCIWYGAIVHAVFNFGGNVVFYAGAGQFQDKFFWIATILVGLIAGVITLLTLLSENRKTN